MPEKQVASLILNTIHHAKAGKGRLVDFLRGSHSQLVKKDKMDRKTGYGALFWHDKNTITGFIEQLLEIGLIERFMVNTGYYSYPILVLTDAGKKTLEDKIEIPLLIRKVQKPFVMSETLAETLKLLEEGKRLSDVLLIRKLKLSTVWSQVAKLIALGKISAKKFVSEEKINLILEARMKTDSNYLKEIKNLLPEDISYEDIRCVLEDRELCKGKQS